VALLPFSNGQPPEWRHGGGRRDLTYRSFRPLLGRAGLPRIRFHNLRHTYATLMLRVAAHPRTVQDILGHVEFGITMDTYTHPSLDSQRELARRLDELLDL
jgi:integrase